MIRKWMNNIREYAQQSLILYADATAKHTTMSVMQTLMDLKLYMTDRVNNRKGN